MKILILCKKFPYPLTEGEPIAISYLCKSLSKVGCSVSLFLLNTSKHYYEVERFPKKENHFDSIYSVKTNNDINIKGAVTSILKNESYLLSRFYSKDYDDKLKELLQENQFDVIQLETIYMAHYIQTIRNNCNSLITIRTHNVEHLIWNRVAKMTTNVAKKWYLKYQNNTLKNFELEKINECDLIVSITSNDLDKFKDLGLNKKGVAIPVGFNLNEYDTQFLPSNEKQSIAFIGALDWMPNQDGVVWFLEQVWPAIKRAFPQMEFHIAGKNTPKWMSDKSGNGVVVHGQVPDAKEFIKEHPVFIAPLFSGSGIKIKVLQGLALGRAVVTTPIGLEGIPAKHQTHLFVADGKKAFIHAINACFSNNIELLKIRKAGREFIKNEFDSDYLAEKLKQVYTDLSGKQKHKT